MSYRKYYPAQEDELKNVVSLRRYISTEIFQSDSPYISNSRHKIILQKIFLTLSDVLMWGVGRDFFVENKDRELIMFSKPARRLLVKLLSEKRILNWDLRITNRSNPQHFLCELQGGSIVNPKGVVVPSGALNGYGTSLNPNEALIIAAAELIERMVASEWEEKDLQYHSISELERSNKSMMFHSYYGDLSSSDMTRVMGWVKTKDLHTQKTVLVPASMVYMHYGWGSPEEDIFVEITSNGVAAQTTLQSSVLHSFYELIERDGFLMYWLNNLAPEQIDIETIPSEKIQDIFAEIQKRNFSIHLLNCKTEYDIPVLVLVVIDNATGVVNVDAVAGLNIDEMIAKLFVLALKWNLHLEESSNLVAENEMVSISSRSTFWHQSGASKNIAFFIKGNYVSYTEYVSQFDLPSTLSVSNSLRHLKRKLKENNTPAYYFAYKNKLANSSGLFVVRAIAPDLVPMYFNESKKPKNVARLYAFAKKMGFADRPKTGDDLNLIPHPFA